jgi:hypothetical protein
MVALKFSLPLLFVSFELENEKASKLKNILMNTGIL